MPSIPVSCLKVPTAWSPPDGLWISTFDCNGLVGLSLLYVVMELPVIFFLVRFPVHLWRDPLVAPAMVAAALLGIYMVDCLLNSFANIVYVSLAGGLVGVTPMQFGISSKGLYRAKRMPDRAGFPPQPNTVEVQSDSHAVSVANQMAVVDQYRRLGRNLKSEGRWADAYLAWQQAFDLLTDLTRHSAVSGLQQRWCDCGNDLAWLLLSHPDLDPCGSAHALTLATQVVDRCSDGEVYWNTLGVAFLRNGDPRAAIAALTHAVALASEDNPFNHVFLAMAYARLGDREQAQLWLAQAILLKGVTSD